MSDTNSRDRLLRIPPSLMGAAYMLFAGLSASIMAGGVRHLTDNGFPPIEAAFFRNLFGFAAMTPILVHHGMVSFRTRRLGLHVLRSVLNVTCMLMMFTAIALTPLAKIQSLNFTTPMFATMFAAVILHEHVSRSRWTAVAIGVLGATVILRPGIDAIDTGAILVLIASVVWALVMMAIKVLARTDSPVTITCYSVSFLTVFSFLPALFVWVWPHGNEWLWLVFIGVTGTAAHLSVAQALKLADASALMPLEFIRLLWVALIGFVFFAEKPSIWTWCGAAIIVASCTYLARQETRKVPTH